MESIGKVSGFFCEICDYRTSVKSNYTKHCLTARHKNVMKCNRKVSESINDHPCRNCGKVYKSNVGLWRHNKYCIETSRPESPLNDYTILSVLKENQEIKTLLVEQQKENKELMNRMIEISQQQLSVPTTIINNPTTNNNNNTFNLNFFLNETCKDAMNIQEFLETIRIQFDDLMTIGDAGFVNGVSDIIIKQLKDLEINKRPIHCTDSKRETIYLKEQSAWNKDDKSKTKLKKVIEKIEYKNVVALKQWCTDNPDSIINNTPNNLLRDKIYLETLQGDDKTRDKIIKNISKEIIIEKDDNKY